MGSTQAFVNWRYTDNSSLKLQYGRSIDEAKNPAYNNEFNTSQDQINLTGIHALPLGKAVYGAEYLNQNLESDQYSDVEDRTVKSVFAGYQIAENSYDVQANARYDDNSQYGEETTYNLGLSVKPTDNIRVGASYATGFRSPTFNDLTEKPYWGGNPNLKAETSKNAEIFAEYNNNYTNTRLTSYRNDVEDLISYTNGQMTNIGVAKIEGINLTSDWYLNNYLFGLSYDYQQATDDKKDSKTYNNSLPFRPEHKGLVYAGYANEDFDIRAEYQYVDEYYSNLANADNQTVDGYGLVNFSGNYYLTPALTLSARINNLTNKKYITTPGYNADGTNVFGSLTYTWF